MQLSEDDNADYLKYLCWGYFKALIDEDDNGADERRRAEEKQQHSEEKRRKAEEDDGLGEEEEGFGENDDGFGEEDERSGLTDMMIIYSDSELYAVWLSVKCPLAKKLNFKGSEKKKSNRLQFFAHGS